MDKSYLKRVSLKGIHRRYDLDMDFNKTLNVLHGQNGTGKSTLIHIIANVANCDFIRFAFIEFERIIVEYSNGTIVTVRQEKEGSEKSVRIETNKGGEFSYKKSHAIDSVRAIGDERFHHGHESELVTDLNEFCKENELKFLSTSYFPAFRTMLEAWASQRDHREHRRMRKSMSTERATTFSRGLFGDFLPIINFPSPIDIEDNLREEIREAQVRIGRYESSVFSDSFVKVFSALLEGPQENIKTEELLIEISDLTKSTNVSKLGIEQNSKTYEQLRLLMLQSSSSNDLANSAAAGALSVYRDALKERQEYQASSFEKIDKYFEVVNSFLDKKELSYELDQKRRIPKVGMKFPDGSWSNIRVMSSGERQLLTMLYAVNKMSGNSVVLIDEPELSLHIDWQEELLEKMMEQLGDRQIIVCTHSPSIAADFDDYMKEVVPVFKELQGDHEEDLDENEELI